MSYGGNDEKKNTLDFRIYTDGIATLSGIIKQIKNNELPLDARKDIIQNLLTGMDVCGPGIFTHITNTYLELLSQSNITIYWMKLRRSIAEQVVLELMKQEKEIYQGMEIHYVNGVLNRFGDALGIQMIEDGYVANCDPNILDRLFVRFKTHIFFELRLSKLIDFASQDTAFENLVAKLESVAPEVYADNIKKLGNALKRFGPESPDKPFYLNDSSIIQLYGEFDDKIAVDWKAHSIIFLSIYSRMQQAGLINLEEQETLLLNKDKLKVWSLGESLSLRFAYLYEERDGKIACIPLVGYCVETLAEIDSPRKADLLQLLFSSEISHTGRLEIALGIARYLNSTLAKIATKKNHQLHQPLMDLLPKLMISHEGKIDVDDFLHIFSFLPKEHQEKYIRLTVGKIKTPTIQQLKTILLILPAVQRMAFLESLGADFIKTIIHDSDTLVYMGMLDYMLEKLPEAERMAFVQSLGVDFIKSIIGNSYHLFVLLRPLPEAQRTALVQSLGVDFIKGVTNDLISVVEWLPEAERMAFVQSLGVDIIKGVIGTTNDLISVVEALPGNQRTAFVQSLGVDIIKDVIGITNDLISVVETLPGNQRLVFLKSLGADFIKSIIHGGDELASLLKQLSEGEWKSFIESFGVDVIIIINNSLELVVVLKELLDTKRLTFLESLGAEVIKNIIKTDKDLIATLVELPPSHCPAFLMIFLGYHLDTPENLMRALGILDVIPYSYSDPKKLEIRTMALYEILKVTKIDVLEAAYSHPYFSRHRDDTKAREAFNKFGALFSTKKSLIETGSQQQIMKRIEELQQSMKKIKELGLGQKEEKEVKGGKKK